MMLFWHSPDNWSYVLPKKRLLLMQEWGRVQFGGGGETRNSAFKNRCESCVLFASFHHKQNLWFFLKVCELMDVPYCWTANFGSGLRNENTNTGRLRGSDPWCQRFWPGKNSAVLSLLYNSKNGPSKLVVLKRAIDWASKLSEDGSMEKFDVKQEMLPPS